jgi:hypothetical protein
VTRWLTVIVACAWLAQAAEATEAVRETLRAPGSVVVVTHGSVVSDLTGLNVRMGTFVVLRRGPDRGHTVAGELSVP